MKTIATLGPSVRLVVFQFLMKSAQVPAIVPPKRVSSAPPLSPVHGVKVLESTPQVDLFPLAIKLASIGTYELVDVWKKPHETNWKMSFVRFVFCHKEHVKPDELFPDFIAKKDALEKMLIDLAHDNLWATQGYLNPYFEKDGKPSGHQVLMFGCRRPDSEHGCFQGGRDENNRGVGQKVQLSIISPRIDLLDGDEVYLKAPTVVRQTASAPVA